MCERDVSRRPDRDVTHGESGRFVARRFFDDWRGFKRGRGDDGAGTRAALAAARRDGPAAVEDVMSIVRQLGVSPVRSSALAPLAVLLLSLPACGPRDEVSIAEPEPTTIGDSTTSCEDTATVDYGSLLVSDANVSPALAVTSSALFWVDRGESITDTIQAYSLSDGTTETIFSASPSTAAIEDIVTDGKRLYFVEVSGALTGGYTSTIESLKLDGGSATVLATDDTDDLELAVADGYVYFSSGSQVQRVSTEGGPVESVSVGGAITAAAGAVYWTNGSSNLEELSSASGKAITLIQGQVQSDSITLGTLTANGSAVFWPCHDDNGGLLCGAEAGLVNGTTRILAPLDSGSSMVAADDSNVYFIDTGTCSSWLGKVPVGGGAVTTMSSGFSTGTELSTAHAIAVDDTSVYWTALGYGVFSTPK
jgi:hypothetical protein